MLSNHRPYARGMVVKALALLAWLAAPPLVLATPGEPSPDGRSAFGAGPYLVGVVPSDYPGLARPVARTDSVDAEQVLDMTRRAVDLVGGMAAVVPDSARLVLIKPNVVSPTPPGSGVTSDPRVVRAVALLVHEVAPRARILVAEGPGGWMSPALRDCTDVQVGPETLVDGFEVGGYRRMVADLRRDGLDIDCFDLNFDRTRHLTVPGGGLARDEYDLPEAVLDADVWINVPVAKTHGSKITCCMKNHFGLLPGTLYGWSKDHGTEGHRGIPHAPGIVDEAWIDLWTLTQVDLNVVDMIAGTEAGAFTGAPRRSNLIVAGRNPVATDLTVARLMGFNPDDFEFAELARQRGLGPASIDAVQILGADVGPLVHRFKKAGAAYGSWGEWGQHAEYGMGPRWWTLLGPVPLDHAFTPGELASLAPTPGEAGWSPETFFGHDRIDLDKHYDDPLDCSVYAFTRLAMPKADSVRFWAGSDDDLKVWIDGQPVYEHQGRRRHQLGQDRVAGFLTAGEHRLLVRASQARGDFEFSFNICEPIDDPLYAGNTYPGLRYYVSRPGRKTMAEGGGIPAPRVVAADDIGDGFGGDLEPLYEVTFPAPDPLTVWRNAPDSVLLDVAAPAHRDLVGLLVQQAGWGPAMLDSTTLNCLSQLPFGLAYIGASRQQYARYFGYPMEPVRVLGWLGVKYGLTHGYGLREAAKSVQGWLAGGWVPIVGYGDGWALATGYRRARGAAKVRLATPDTILWQDLQQPWDGSAPGGQRLSCPVVVVEPGAPAPSPASLVDSVATVALEMARTDRFVFDKRDWGEHYVLTGLAAWDAWVIDWERQPWTPEWARDPMTRGNLSALREQYLGELAAGRSLAARFFAAAGTEPGALELAAAGTAYAEVAGRLRELAALLPEAPAGDESAEDRERLNTIVRARPLLGQARDAERRAAAALGRHLGVTEPLAKVAEDPLRHKDRGRKLATWRTQFSKGVCDVTIHGDSLSYVLREGKPSEGLVRAVVNPMPRRKGWQVAVEAIRGEEFYRVLQQPSAANDWTCVLRLDEMFNMGGRPTELVIWAVPPDK